MLASCTTAYENAAEDLDFIRVDGDAFAECESNSVDYAVMEKADNAMDINASNRLVAALGIENISIIETNDCILVAHNDHAQNAKKFAALLREAGRNEADTHSKCYRPWGSYQTINLGQRFQVKRITVKPGVGATHRLDNPGKIPLELIEVQSGSYLGEDDIVRFDDVYGRSGTSN